MYLCIFKLIDEIVPEYISNPTKKTEVRVEALNSLSSAISQAVISCAIQNVSPISDNQEKMDYDEILRIIAELYFNFDFVTCVMGEAEHAKILLAKGSVKSLNELNISPGITVQGEKRRSIKILFITDAAGHVVGALY